VIYQRAPWAKAKRGMDIVAEVKRGLRVAYSFTRLRITSKSKPRQVNKPT
jgi:hypothetical protein